MRIEIDNAVIRIPNFERDEFDCKCCGKNKMQGLFLWMLQQVRTESGIPMRINSGFRCPSHNKDVGSKNTSDHRTGEGSDIEVISSHHRFRILDAAFKSGFKRIGMDKKFIHLGTRRSNPQEVLWMY